MQPPHKNENLLFKDFQDFLVRSQQFPHQRIPVYLRWINRFHESCSRQHWDGLTLHLYKASEKGSIFPTYTAKH